MTLLDDAIAFAYKNQGKQESVNKVYLLLLHTTLYVPIKKGRNLQSEEPFQPLFAKIDERYFMLAFDTVERLTDWAGEHYKDIDYVELSGRDVIAGINAQVFLGLNFGTDFYKEFSPDEVIHLKKIVAKLDQLKT